MTKRKCIFTGKESNYLAQLGNDKHNWAKKVPCTREWWEGNKDRPLTPSEFKLVELFFEQEIARLKTDNIEEEMQRIRDGKVTVVSTEDWEKLQEHLNNPPEPTPALVNAMKRHQEFIEENNREFSPQIITKEDRELFEQIQVDENTTIIDEPEDLKKEDVEEILKEPLKIPENAEINLLTTPKEDGKIKKKVVKKKKISLWD